MVPRILEKCARIKAGDGEIFVAAALQGRIFAALEGELLQRRTVRKNHFPRKFPPQAAG